VSCEPSPVQGTLHRSPGRSHPLLTRSLLLVGSVPSRSTGPCSPSTTRGSPSPPPTGPLHVLTVLLCLGSRRERSCAACVALHIRWSTAVSRWDCNSPSEIFFPLSARFRVLVISLLNATSLSWGRLRIRFVVLMQMPRKVIHLVGSRSLFSRLIANPNCTNLVRSWSLVCAHSSVLSAI
jgi:hypothetical protein